MDPLLPRYLYGCYRWNPLLPRQIFGWYSCPLCCHTISMVAIDGTLYCHGKYLVARGSLSNATLNIVVAISGTLYCHDKWLVARGCLSIAMINTWWLYFGPSIAMLIVFRYVHCLYIFSLFLYMPTVFIYTNYVYIYVTVFRYAHYLYICSLFLYMATVFIYTHCVYICSFWQEATAL
jgi:hypothetical protein